MKLQLNGEVVETDATDLADLLIAKGFGDLKVATAVNGAFVPATLRKGHEINNGDSIEVLAPMQGG